MKAAEWYADNHIHTSFSGDSECPMEDYIQAAINASMDEICFTEHIDYGVKTDTSCNLDLYRKEFLRCYDKYSNKISIKFGIEFGVQKNTVEQYKKTFYSKPFDFVILSCHQADNLEFWTYEFQDGKSQREYNEAYYGEILEVVRRYKDYCVIGHLDMIRRYDNSGEYPFEQVEAFVREILKAVIRDGKGTEINGSATRYNINDGMPSTKILKIFYELGGEIITFGSDAHTVEHMTSQNYQMELQRLRAIGFKAIFTFDRMKPISHGI